jgi:Fibronectin type III domain
MLRPRSGTQLQARAKPHQRWPHFRWLALLILVLAYASSAAPSAAQTSADSTVTLVWTASGDDGTTGTATSYDLRYRTVGVTGTDTTSWWNAATPVTGLPIPRVAGSTDSMKVKSLTPLTTYYFVLRVADEVPNWSGFSNLAVKTTSGDATPPSAIADLAVTSVTGTSITVRWTAPGDDGNTGTATSYDIRYSTATITNANWASATPTTGEPVPTAAGTQQTFTITGLTGSRTYYIAMKTTDNAGLISGLSNVPSGTTSDTVAPAPVRDLSMDPDSEPVDPVAYEGATIELASRER